MVIIIDISETETLNKVISFCHVYDNDDIKYHNYCILDKPFNIYCIPHTVIMAYNL